MRKWWKWLAGAIVVVVVLAVGIPFIYIHLIEGPAPSKLALPTTHSTTTVAASGATSAAASAGGTYNVGSGSEAGYRVTEVLVGQNSTAVGRTTKIWGSVTISGDSVTAGTFTVDMASVVSDQSERNAQFDGRIMDVSRYPTAALKLTVPISLGTLPALGTTYTATGDLTMHGVTRAVSFPLAAERTADGIYALADLPILFSDWDIANPSVGGFVTTESSGTLEVLVHLTKGAGNPVTSGSNSSSNGNGGAPGEVTVPKTTVPSITIPSS